MIVKRFIDNLDQHWTEVSKHVRDSLVFMDDASAECLHWHGGLRRILDGGAISVENFSPFVRADSKIKKAVFIIMSPILAETLRTLMVIIRANSFRNCIIISSLPSKCHCEGPSEDGNFTSLENHILNWMGHRDYSACIYHIPLFAAYLTKNMFIMPSFTNQLSVFKSGLQEMNMKRIADISLRDLSQDMQTSIKNLACSLSSHLDTLQIKGDFFSLGRLSHVLCSELENLSQNTKRKVSSNKASVLIVDRLLDLAGPLSQSYETMLDLILRALPHFPGHVLDVCVSMGDLATCKSESVFGRHLLAPGCLAHKSTAAEISNLNSILCEKPREALIQTNRSVVECASAEGIALELSARLTPEALRNRIISFKKKPKSLIKNCGILQQALALVQALEYSKTNSVDHLSAIEKALIQFLATSPEEVLSNIMQMVAEKEEMNYKMEEIIIFLAFFYMLSGCSSVENESAMQATLMETFFQDSDTNDLASLFVEGELEDDNVVNAVRTFFDVLKRLGTMRKGLKKYTHVFKSTNPAYPASYCPLLKQLLNDIFNTAIPDLPDVEFHSAGLKDYLKTGFSLFMNVAKPQPRDNPVIFLIMLGGITPAEIKAVQEIAAHQKLTEVIVGCTNILTPPDVLRDLGLIVKELSTD
ncbi:Sec1 family domain-containing protein 2, partial [Stegodyphus mimosarum]